jgi:hypothetical protein
MNGLGINNFSCQKKREQNKLYCFRQGLHVVTFKIVLKLKRETM